MALFNVTNSMWEIISLDKRKDYKCLNIIPKIHSFNQRMHL
jgi:hypothetical protein